MLLKTFLFTALYLCVCVSVYPEELSSKREKVLILPFQNESDTKQYVNSWVFREIFSRSFYSYISILPVIDVPDYGKNNNVLISPSNIQAFSEKEKAKIVIYGDYRLSGERLHPVITMDLTAYDSIGRTNIFNKTYKTTTGIEIFDDIDNMISEVLKGALNIDMKNIAAIHFMDFRIANENYMLYINDRLIASPSNTNFSLILKIIPEKNYSIVLKQADGDRTVRRDRL